MNEKILSSQVVASLATKNLVAQGQGVQSYLSPTLVMNSLILGSDNPEDFLSSGSLKTGGQNFSF